MKSELAQVSQHDAGQDSDTSVVNSPAKEDHSTLKPTTRNEGLKKGSLRGKRGPSLQALSKPGKTNTPHAIFKSKHTVKPVGKENIDPKLAKTAPWPTRNMTRKAGRPLRQNSTIEPELHQVPSKAGGSHSGNSELERVAETQPAPPDLPGMSYNIKAGKGNLSSHRLGLRASGLTNKMPTTTKTVADASEPHACQREA